LPNATAFAMAVPVKAEQAFLLDHRVLHARDWGQEVDRNAVMLAYLTHELVGLRVQAAVDKAYDLVLLVELPCHVHQDDILGTAEGKPEVVAKVLEGKFENVLGRTFGIQSRLFGDIEGVTHQASA